MHFFLLLLSIVTNIILQLVERFITTSQLILNFYMT